MIDSELTLRYGCNPHQTPASVRSENLPMKVLNGSPGYINLLDAVNSWQLVRELGEATGLPAAASFKHVSPAGAAVGVPLDDTLTRAYFVKETDVSPPAAAYARARGADRMSSYGDWVALSDTVDVSTARILRPEASDGIIAPGYDPEALAILSKKHKGRYVVIEMDPEYVPDDVETREVYGITFVQRRNNQRIDTDLLEKIVTRNRELHESAKRDLLVALATLKYTQSNSVCLARDGQAIGVGAGQQSRILCTRLAGDKADNWYLRQHPKVLGLRFRKEIRRTGRTNAIDLYFQDDLTPEERATWESAFEEVPTPLTAAEKREWLDGLTDVATGSDAYIPFRDNIDRAHRSGVRYIVQPGNSLRDGDVVHACDEYGMAMALPGLRLFHH